jgi:kynurenine formamidase
VKTGKTYSLAIETNRTTPAYSPRSFQLFVVQPGDGTGQPLGANQLTGNDDLLLTWLGIGTQIDGLGHVGINHRYYNGNQAHDFVDPEGLRKFGTHTIPPIVTRGVLLDMAAYLGVSLVQEGTAYNRKEIQGAIARQGTTIEKGDVVIFHSGWMQLLGKDNKRWLDVHPGLGGEGAQYLADLGVVAVGADTAALEVIPFEDPDRPFPVHQILLTKNGVYVLENIRTEELARERAYEFLFVLGQPKFAGAVQMVINPIAIR